MNFELTDEQRNIARQKILELSESDMVLRDTTNNYDFIKQAARDIKNGVPVKEDMLKAVLSLILVFEVFDSKRK